MIYTINWHKITREKNTKELQVEFMHKSIVSTAPPPTALTYIRVTRNSNEIPILYSNNSVGHLTQVNEGTSISFFYTICFYGSLGQGWQSTGQYAY